MKFWLIQRGKINKGDNFKGITGNDGFARLDYMGSAEFEWGAIPKAYRRMMWNFESYEVFNTGLKNQNEVPFNIYCKKGMEDETISAIKEYIISPYGLKEYFALDSHFNNDKSEFETSKRKGTNFWWDIRNDWIGFFGEIDRVSTFENTVNKDHSDWWMLKDEKERKTEYEESLKS